MLQAIRDKTTGWISYFIIILISVPFALFGITSYLGGGVATPPATVNGESITQQALDSSYSNYRRQLEQRFGGTIPAYLGSEEQLKDRVLTQLIETSVLSQYANQKYYRISDAELSKSIRAVEEFQTEGQFDANIYRSQLSSMGYSIPGFEQQYRLSESVEQIQKGIDATAFTVGAIKNKLLNLSNQTRKVRVLTRPMEDQEIDVSEQEIEDYYNQNIARFMTQEQVRIDYIELNLDSIKSTIEVTDEQLLERYEQSKDSVYSAPEYRTASHILLELDEDASSGESEELRLKLSEIRDQVLQGESFAELAKVHSEDSGSASSGGSLGEVERGMMVEPFEDALFAMEKGAVSEPVKTPFGWHLIQLEDVSGGDVTTFDEVKSDIADEMLNEIAEGQIYDLSESLANMAYENPDSLEPAAEELGLKLQTSDWFDASNGSGIADEIKVRGIAFSNTVLEQKLNSEAIELSDNRIVFIRVNEHKPAKQQLISDVSDQIDSIIRERKGRDENSKLGQQALLSGESLDDIANDWNVDIIDSGFITRSESGIDRNLVRLAFSMAKPDDTDNGKQMEGLLNADGSYSIVELSAVISNNSDNDKNKVEQLISAEAEAEYQAMLKLLTAKADVTKTPLEDLRY